MAIVTKEQLEQASVDADLLHRFRVGPSTETIPTEEGLKPTIAGIVDQALRAASLDTIPGYTFATGYTITNQNQGLLDTASGEYYRWTGAFPEGGKVVAANSTPATSGGIGPGKWLSAGQSAIRADLLKPEGVNLIGSVASFAQLRGMIPSADGVRVTLREFSTGSVTGGGQFIGRLTAKADDGGIIASNGGAYHWARVLGPFNPDITMFGAVGDASTDNTTAWNNAVAAAKGVRPIIVPAGNFKVVTPAVMKGRLTIVGEDFSALTGNFNYSDTFPASADNPGNVTEASPYVNIKNITFFPITTASYCLTVEAQAGTSFIDCGEMEGCHFYGNLGFLAKNLITFSVRNTRFDSLYKGIRAEGCTNWLLSDCKFTNSRQMGVDLTFNSAALNRKGGENFKFIGCEFRVCTRGIYAFRHVWLTVDACLFDYCPLPFHGQGSYKIKISNSYLGASDQGSLSGNTGYIAPPTSGVALYITGTEADSLGSASYGGVTSVNNEYVSYLTGQTNPIIIVDGNSTASSSSLLADTVSFIADKVIAIASHKMVRMLSINKAIESSVTNVEFLSPDFSTTMLVPYSADNCTIHNGVGNLNARCTQGGVRVQLQYDTVSARGIQAMTGLGVFFKDTTGVDKFGVDSAGQAGWLNATVTATATAGSATLPSAPAGFISFTLNGATKKLPYYN